jgi:hypothetical protein
MLEGLILLPVEPTDGIIMVNKYGDTRAESFLFIVTFASQAMLYNLWSDMQVARWGR